MADVAPVAVSKVDEGAKAAESGDKNALAAVLNAENVYDRAALADGIKKAVEASPGGLPKLELVTKPDATGKNVLTDIQTTDDKGAKASIYHNEMTEGRYSGRYSLSHPKQTTYDTLDPQTGKIISEDVTLADGRKSHNTVEYDPKTQAMTGKSWQWADGMTEHYSYDAAGREIKSDVQWQNSDGKLVHNVTDTKYDAKTNLKASTTDTFSDGEKTETTFDPKGRVLTQDSTGPDNKQYHYTARYSDKSDKLEYEKTVDTTSTMVATFDHETGQPLTRNEAHTWGKFAEEYKYDPTTHNEVYYHRTSDDGREETRKSDAAGHVLSEDSTRADKKTRHIESVWDGDKPVSRDERSYDGSTSHTQVTYDSTTGKRTLMTQVDTSASGAKNTEVDSFDPKTGAILSEDYDRADGSKERIAYDRQPQSVVHGKANPEQLVNITDTETTPDGRSRDYRYEYRHNDTAKPPTQALRLKWSGTGDNGNYTDAEMSRIDNMMYQHIPKLRN